LRSFSSAALILLLRGFAMNVNIKVVIILIPTIYLATLHWGQLASHGYGLL